ncbi:hypothetical protein KR222_001619, partial [Zaprionus bogoriensis]
SSALHRNWHRSTSGDVERNLLRADNLSQNYQLIYRAPLGDYLAWTKNISTATVTLLSLIAGYQLASASSFTGIAKQIQIASLVSNETDLYYFTVGFVLINLAIRVFIARYPLRIYKTNTTNCRYVAVFSSQLPTGTVKHSFERGQISEYRNWLNPWSNIMFKLNQRSSMLLIDYFKTPHEFHMLFEAEKET